MSGFHFRLESLRRIRDGIARQEEVRLGCLFAERSRLQEALLRMAERMRSAGQAREKLAASGALGVELQFMSELQKRWEESAREMETAIAVLDGEIEIQKERYVAAKRKSEELRQLEDEARRSWQVALRRREQAFADEQFLARTLGKHL